MSDTAALGAWRALITAASEPYRAASRFAWRFARAKLRMDPVFRHLLAEGLIAPNDRVLDIGCGQGLLASLLCSSATLAQQDRWPQAWAAPPVATQVIGIELMPRDIKRAEEALGANAQFICGDMRRTPFPEVDAVVILDVLHYVSEAEQNELLSRVRRALRPGGRLLLRVGDAGARPRFVVSQWVDRIVSFVRGHRGVPHFGRSLAAWVAQLESLGFDVGSQPMSQGTPFANVLLVARLGPSA